MSIKVILNQDVLNLGEEGDVCKVADGYARNYLFPQNLAVPYTRQYIVLFDQKKEQIEKRKAEKHAAAISLKEKIEALGSLEIKMPAGEGDKLFGSVNNAMIADQLAASGIEVERKKIELGTSAIKMIGTYPVKVKLYNNETAELKVIVSKEEAKA